MPPYLVQGLNLPTTHLGGHGLPRCQCHRLVCNSPDLRNPFPSSRLWQRGLPWSIGSRENRDTGGWQREDVPRDEAEVGWLAGGDTGTARVWLSRGGVFVVVAALAPSLLARLNFLGRVTPLSRAFIFMCFHNGLSSPPRSVRSMFARVSPLHLMETTRCASIFSASAGVCSFLAAVGLALAEVK
jgi:hypothetical protein